MKFLDTIPNICEGFPFDEGDSVLLNFWGDNEDLQVLDSLSENLSKRGVIPLKNHCSNFFFENVLLNLIRKDQKLSADYLSYLSSFNNVVEIFMYTPSLPKKITEGEIPIFKKYLGELFNALSSDKKHYIQLIVPTEKNALNAGMDYHIYNSLICNALSVDFPKLKKSCKEKVESLKDKGNIRIVTGNRHILDLDIHNREWNVDDGCGDLPPGEVYIAPIENKSTGDLFVPIVNLKGQIYNNVLLTFEKGNLINTSSTALNNFFNSLPLEYKILCEFGIGLNPQVTELVGYTPVDEKAIGTYHIGIGMNHFFGGKNNCPFHMDFVFTSDNIVFS